MDDEFNIFSMEVKYNMRVYKISLSGKPLIVHHGSQGSKDHAWKYWVQLPEDYFVNVPEIKDWLVDSHIPFALRNGRFIDFTNERDYSAFLLRWSGTLTKGFTRDVTIPR